MTDPIYKVTLYAGDLKFTNDYSNVMQFDTKEDRDEYFNHIDDIAGNYSIEIDNAMENKIFLEGGSLKIAFGDINKDALHEVVYCRIQAYLNGGELNNQSTKYYFINSYEIVSSYSDVTVINFSIEYDYWMNNQFDFTIRESNVERSHVDRWDSDGNILYKSPQIDNIDTFMKVNDKVVFESDKVALFIDGRYVVKDVLWCVVTASHTLGRSKPDQLLYHVFPVLYKKEDLDVSNVNYKDDNYYKQNCIKVKTASNIEYYFPALHNLDNAILTYACGNGMSYDGETDVVKIINVQIINHLPVLLGYDYQESTYYITVNRGYSRLEICGGIPFGIFTPSYIAYTSYVVPDLGVFIKYPNDNGERFVDINVPVKPTDNDSYSDTYEPALYMNPVRKHIIMSGDNSAYTEINDEIFLLSYKAHKFKFIYNISYSATALYNYVTLYGFTRDELNVLGFAFNKNSYLWDFISDAWAEYCVTQRDSDRMMMWTNIATGGIAETGSTAVSAGIGYRSNMERSKALQNESVYNKRQAYLYEAKSPYTSETFRNRDVVTRRNEKMYSAMAGSAMAMSGVGGVTAFSANAIHQGMAQRAKEKAIANTPSNLASAGNAFSAIINKEIETVYIEMICEDTAYDKYKNVFMKYGYYIGGVIMPNINSRKYFNYIKTNGAILTGKCNNMILSSIANILDSGVTIWHMDYCAVWQGEGDNRTLVENKMYDYSKENIERSLIA